MTQMQIPEVRTCDSCGREILTVETTDGEHICRTDIEDVEEERRPEGYKHI